MEEKGKTKEELDVKELRELAVRLGLMAPEEAEKSRTKTLLAKIGEWEAEQIKLKEESENAVILEEDFDDEDMEDVVEEAVETAEVLADDTFNGKKVISRTLVSLNGKDYEDILVESGETYRELVK